jgi:Na+(H+)/acetate symporter ActP
MTYPLQDSADQVLVYATLGGVIRTIFWIILISYLLRFIARMSVQYAMSKTQEEMQRQFHQQQQYQQQYQNKQQPTKGHEPVGEYVDYIEIKDDKK